MKSLEAPLPDKPSDKHTVLITCKKPGCGKKRWVKPQDVWQVKLCRWCKDEEKKTKGLARLKVVKARIEVRETIQKETDWPATRRAGHEAGIKALTRYRASLQYKRDQADAILDAMARQEIVPARRVWP